MPYTPTVWENRPSKATPVSAANLNKIETGIKAVTDIVDTGRLSENSLSGTIGGIAVRSTPSPLDTTVGAFPMQKVQGNKWFQGYTVFGNNTGLSAHPRQPHQVNNIVDGSTFIAGEYGSDVVGNGNVVTFKGGFLNEPSFNTANPHDIVGGNDYIITAGAAGAIAGITSFYGRIVEAHSFDPTAALGTFSALTAQVSLENGGTASNVYTAFFHPPAIKNGSVATNAYALYLRASQTNNASNTWSLFVEGKSEFRGVSLFNGALPSVGNAPAGVYAGKGTNTNTGIEIADGTTNFRISNDQAGALSFDLPGTAVLAKLTSAGALKGNGYVSAGMEPVGTRAQATPAAQSTGAGVYIGRGADNTPGMLLANGSLAFRVSNENSRLTFSKPGAGVLLEINESSDLLTKGHLSVADSKDFILGTSGGSRIGSTASQKLGFWGASPVTRPAALPAPATDPASTMTLANALRAHLITIGLAV